MWGRGSLVARVSDSHQESGFVSQRVPLRKALYHACFICGQSKWWSRQAKLTLSVISVVKPIIYIFFIYIYINIYSIDIDCSI